MERDRAVFVAVLCAVSTSISAAALRSMDLSGGVNPPTELGQTGGESLLFALLGWLFSVLGLSGSDFAIPSGSGQLLRILLALLEMAEPYFLPIAVVTVVVIALGLATRRIVGGVSAVTETTSDEDAERDGIEFNLGAVSNEVYRTWGEMVRQLDDENARARTPTEWAEIARESGFDSEFVGEITDSFRAVRYGDEAVTRERYRRDRCGSENSGGKE